MINRVAESSAMASGPHESQPSSERRRYQRVEVSVPGRFMTPDGSEHACYVLNFSFSGIAFSTDAQIAKGDDVIVYIDNLGRFEGPVVRLFNGGFAIQTEINGPRKARVAERVELHSKNASAANTLDRPTAEASINDASGSRIVLEDGRSAECKVVDMSLTGAHIVTDLHVPNGARVTVGRMSGYVVCRTSNGIAIAFDDVPERPNAAAHPFS